LTQSRMGSKIEVVGYLKADFEGQYEEKMTEFGKDIIKIILDKGLLGLIGLILGYYISRLLERYRANKSYELFVWQQKVDACQRVAKIMTEHYDSAIDIYNELLKMPAEQAEQMTIKDLKFYTEIKDKHNLVRDEIRRLIPLLPPEIQGASTMLMNQLNRIIKRKPGDSIKEMPNKEQLLDALAEFYRSCTVVISKGPSK